MKDPKEKIDHKETLKEYWSIVSNYKKLIFLMILAIVIIEISAIIPKYVVAYIIDKGTLFTSEAITRVEFKDAFVIALVVLGVAYLARTIFVYVRDATSARLSVEAIADVKRKYFDHLISLDTEFHTKNKTGSMISKMSRGSGSINGLTDTFLYMMLPVIIQLVIVSVSIAYFTIIPAIIFLVTCVSFVGYSFILQMKQKRDQKIFNDAEDSEKGIMSDFFLNIESIKHFGKDKKIKEAYKKLTEDTKQKDHKFISWYTYMDTGQNFILGVGTVLLLFFPLLQFMNGEITLGAISFVYTAFLGFLGVLYSLVWGLRNYYRHMTDLESLFEYKNSVSSIVDKKDAKELKVKRGDVSFKDVDFTYPKGEKIFKKFNLQIPSGKKVALVGHSGSGKTTLVKLLYRLYDVNSGKVVVDGKDIRDVKHESLRAEMAIVSQEPILFDDTIYNNIKFSRPNATRKEVEKAITFAQLDKVIKKLPSKEHTIVGERGIKLSTGQKQRVSIARALLANKKILILDEATSALDSETENEIQKDLEKLMKNRTSIIIAHRLSTIMSADIVVVLKDGKILQQGTHKELIKKPGEYKKLWKFQKGGYLEDGTVEKISKEPQEDSNEL